MTKPLVHIGLSIAFADIMIFTVKDWEGTGFGVVIGAAVGVALNNIAIGIGIGFVFAAAPIKRSEI